MLVNSRCADFHLTCIWCYWLFATKSPWQGYLSSHRKCLIDCRALGTLGSFWRKVISAETYVGWSGQCRKSAWYAYLQGCPMITLVANATLGRQYKHEHRKGEFLIFQGSKSCILVTHMYSYTHVCTIQASKQMQVAWGMCPLVLHTFVHTFCNICTGHQFYRDFCLQWK